MNKKFIAKPTWLSVFLICAAIAISVKAYTSAAANHPSAAPASQDINSLDRRLSTLEQRLYAIESNINRLEQQAISSRSSTPTPTTPLRDPEVNRLLSEVETLKGRVRELECGVVHLDERTLSASTKEAQRRTGGQSKDPCRVNSETPVKLSMRP